MKALVLGSGSIGSVIARDFASGLRSWNVVSADLELSRAQRVVSAYEGSNLTAAAVDVGRWGELVSYIGGFDLVMGALPGSAGFSVARACVEAGVDLVDVSFSPEDPFELAQSARDRGILFVPDCGVAPGLSNLLVGRAVSGLDSVEAVHVMVGGLPVRPIPPLGYVVTWSVESLVDEYTRKARIVEGGKMVEVDALTGEETVDFPGVGHLEAFYTDGARTLFRTIGTVRSMWEKTMRYPGHLEGIKLLRDLGLFDSEPIDVGGFLISPRLLTTKLFDDRLRIPGVGDLLAMKADVCGARSGSNRSQSFTLLDFFDKANGTSAMARTTAFTASVVSQLVARGEVREKGLVTPEELGMRKGVFSSVLAGLKERGVVVSGGTVR